MGWIVQEQQLACIPVCRTLGQGPLAFSACLLASQSLCMHACTCAGPKIDALSVPLTLDKGPLGGSLGRNSQPSPARRAPFGKGLSNIFESSTDDVSRLKGC
eukprot:scaffold271867_cov20-Tisochrysis_lutea.AAC.2